MPRSLRQVVDHAEELRLSDHVVGSPRLREAVLAVGRAEAGLARAVKDARAQRVSWADIGVVLGVSGQAARQRYKEQT